MIKELTMEKTSVPVGWEVSKISEVCSLKPPKKLAKDKLDATDLVSFFPMAHLKAFDYYINPKRTKKLEEVYKGYVFFENNDVLLAKITPCFENGKLGIAKDLENGIGFGSSEYHVLRPGKNILSEFIYYFLSLNWIRTLGKEKMTGAVGHRRVPKEFILNLDILIPPLPQQKQIVAILDKAFAAIDIAKANAEQNLQNAKELFESYLQNVFEDKGEDWEVKTLGDICDFFNGFAFKSKDSIDGSNTQVLRMGNLYQNTLNLNRRPAFYPNDFSIKYKKYLLKENDLIISLTGTTGKEDYGYTVKIPKSEKDLLLNQRIAKFIIKDSKVIDRDFLFRFLLSRTFLDELYKTANGTRQANLSTQTMKELLISFPPLKEQKKIVKKLDQLSTQTQKLEALYTQKIADLEEMKKSVLQKAFSGQLKL